MAKNGEKSVVFIQVHGMGGAADGTAAGKTRRRNGGKRGGHKGGKGGVNRRRPFPGYQAGEKARRAKTGELVVV